MFELTSQALFFLSALGAFNGILLAGYLALYKNHQLNYLFLSALIFMLSIRVGKSVLFYFYPGLDETILQIGLSACFLIGPMTYFYTLSEVGKFNKLNSKQLIHLGLLLCPLLLVGVLFPYALYPDFWGTYIYKLVNYTWLGYLLITAYVLYINLFKQGNLFKSQNTLLLSVYIGDRKSVV